MSEIYENPYEYSKISSFLNVRKADWNADWTHERVVRSVLTTESSTGAILLILGFVFVIFLCIATGIFVLYYMSKKTPPTEVECQAVPAYAPPPPPPPPAYYVPVYAAPPPPPGYVAAPPPAYGPPPAYPPAGAPPAPPPGAPPGPPTGAPPPGAPPAQP